MRSCQCVCEWERVVGLVRWRECGANGPVWRKESAATDSLERGKRAAKGAPLLRSRNEGQKGGRRGACNGRPLLRCGCFPPFGRAHSQLVVLHCALFAVHIVQ